MDAQTHYLPERLNSDHVRSVLEVLFELEMQLPAHDSRWSELRMVRRVLGEMLIETDNREGRRAEASPKAEPSIPVNHGKNGNGKLTELPTREEVFLRSRQPARLAVG